VTDAGSGSSAESSNGLPTVTDPTSQSISQSLHFTLTVGTNTTAIDLTGSSLNALAQAINSSGAGVQATIINVGSPSQADYRLALQSTGLGPSALQLNDGPSNSGSNLLTTVAGSYAAYTVNGQPSGGISSDSSTVTIAPGLTVNLLAVGTATIKVAENPTSISNALSGFVNAFNSAQAELQKSYGQNAGALSGDSTVFSTSQALSQIAGYTSSTSGSIQSLNDLGVAITQQGTLTFDATKLSGMSNSQLADAVSFLGDATSGFLAGATNSLNGLLDPITGLIPNEISGFTKQQTAEEKSISDQQASVAQLQTDLTNRMNAADALITSLEQQTSFLTQLFSTMNANNFAGH
jgi:flagellar hook-associated protein 2